MPLSRSHSLDKAGQAGHVEQQWDLMRVPRVKLVVKAPCAQDAEEIARKQGGDKDFDKGMSTCQPFFRPRPRPNTHIVRSAVGPESCLDDQGD